MRKGEVSVEFVGPQQPNGEMAQWGNMPQRGNMAQRGKCGSTLENDWGLNPGPPGYILGALTTELYGPEYRVLVSDSYQLDVKGTKDLQFFLRGGTKYGEQQRWLMCTHKARKGRCNGVAGVPQKGDMMATG